MENNNPTKLRALFSKAANMFKRIDTGVRTLFSQAKATCNWPGGDIFGFGLVAVWSAVSFMGAALPNTSFWIRAGLIVATADFAAIAAYIPYTLVRRTLAAQKAPAASPAL